jgi:PEGA domain-containing protein
MFVIMKGQLGAAVVLGLMLGGDVVLAQGGHIGQISSGSNAGITSARPGPARPTPPAPGPGRPVSPPIVGPSRSGISYDPRLHPRFTVCAPYLWGYFVYEPFLDTWYWSSDMMESQVPTMASDVNPTTAESGLSRTDAAPVAIPVGGLQLDVEPRNAQVYVDGYYAGPVDNFSGYYHHLDVLAGPHVVQFLAPGYDPLTVAVTVVPDRTTIYRSTLPRAPGR